MKDNSPSAKQDDGRRFEKLRTELDGLHVRIKQWQDTEKLLRHLVSSMSMLVKSPDPVLSNNLQLLRTALQQGENILRLNSLIKDVSLRVQSLVNNTEAEEDNTSKSVPGSDAEIKKQIYLIQDVLLVLLEKINFPSAFADEIKKIAESQRAARDGGIGLQVLSGVTALAEVLDEIFYTIKDEKQKFSLFLKQINSDLLDLDEGITASTHLQEIRKSDEDEINGQVETQMLEMESLITGRGDIEQIKQAVQGSVSAIRSHMEKFKQRADTHNQHATEMTDKLRRQLSNMESQYEELKKQVLENSEQSMSDPVTGIRNRLAYEEAIFLEFERYKRYGRPLTLLMFDLDNFKPINDHFGPGTGDKLLKVVAHIIAANIRSVDFLARYGNDEFVIILPELGKLDGKRVAAKICQAVEEKSLKIGGHKIRITVSGGIATIRAGEGLEELYERVDTALYLAKEKGGNRCEVG